MSAAARAARDRSLIREALENRASPLSMFMRKGADGRLQGWSMLRVMLGLALAKWLIITVAFDQWSVVALAIILGMMPVDTLVAAVPLAEMFGWIGAKAQSAIAAAASQVGNAIKSKVTVETSGGGTTVIPPPATPEQGEGDV